MHFQPFQRLKLKNFPGDHARGPPLSTHANTFKTRPPFVNLLRNLVSNDRSYPPPPVDLPLRSQLVCLLVRSHLPVDTGLQRARRIKFHVTILDFEISR